jgi:hypothetical protein
MAGIKPNNTKACIKVRLALASVKPQATTSLTATTTSQPPHGCGNAGYIAAF